MTQEAITSEAPKAATEGQIGHIKDLLNPTLRHLNSLQAQAIIEAGNLLQERFEEIISGMMYKLSEIYPVTINYNRSFAEMIEAGQYDYANGDINEQNFPLSKGESSVVLVSVHFGREMTYGLVMAEFEKMGLRPATLPELIAFNENFPDKLCAFPIVALGSTWQDLDVNKWVYVVYAIRDMRDCNLRLNLINALWPSYARFLAVSR